MEIDRLRVETMTVLLAVSIPRTQTVVLKCYFSLKETRDSGEKMADSKSVAENDKKGLEYVVSQIRRKLSKTVRIISKRLPVHPKISLGKDGTVGASITIIIILINQICLNLSAQNELITFRM